eukprot:scaffold8372_cov76-Cyclotella_meneghiniana.AAC.4
MGTVHVMTVGLAMVGLLFFCMSFAFGVQSSNVLVVFLTIGQFSLGASMSAITTGYYSLTSVLFVNVEAAMSYIESSVGLGAYRGVSSVVLLMAVITRRCFVKHLNCTNCNEEFELDQVDLEIQDVQKDYENDAQVNASNRRNCKKSNKLCNNDIDTANFEERDELNPCDTPIPTTLTLLRQPKITCSALTILWISASWCFLEPILAKRLVQFDLGKLGIGVMCQLVTIRDSWCAAAWILSNTSVDFAIADNAGGCIKSIFKSKS